MGTKHPNIKFDIDDWDTVETLNPVMHQLDSLLDEFPGAASQMTEVSLKARRFFSSGTTWAHVKGGRIMEFNRLPFVDHPDQLLRSLARSESIGFDGTRFHPIGCDSFESIVTHEFGHVLDGYYKRKYVAFADGVRASGFGLVSDTWRMFMDKVRSTKQLSEYALENHAEAFAEAFAFLRHAPVEAITSAPPYVKKVQAMLSIVGDERRWVDADKLRWFQQLSDAEKDSALKEMKAMAKAMGLSI